MFLLAHFQGEIRVDTGGVMTYAAMVVEGARYVRRD